MKIRRIKFSNINNLKGQHEINFDQLPLKTAGIFAITGPTGAGKSTILDVITLALFNRIPRFKKSISKGEIQGLGSILTHHTSEATASIEYEIKGQVHVSSWSVSKARTGNLKDYEMTLMDNTGSYLDLKKSDVPGKNEEIIGLKYDQFIKSIILSQGQFSRFLKADKNERGQLLENLTGTSIYRKIGIQTYQKFKTVNDLAKLEKEKLEVIQPLAAEERAAIAVEIKDTKEKVQTLDKQLTLQENLVAVKKELLGIAQEQEKNEQEKAALAQKEEITKADEAKLHQHEKLAPLQGDLKLYQKSKSDKASLSASLASTANEQGTAKTAVDRLIEQVAGLTSKPIDRENLLAEVNKFESEVLALDRQKEDKIKRGKEQRDLINQKKDQYHLTIEDKISSQAGLDLLSSDKDLLVQKLATAGLDRAESIPNSKTNLRTKQAQYQQLIELNRLLAEHEQLSEAILAEQESLKTLDKTIAELDPLIEQSEKLLEQLKTSENLLIKQKEDAIKIAELESLRSDLIDGKPCPLCGAVHHPFSAHAPEDERSEIDQRITDTQQAVAKEIGSLEKVKEQRTTCIARKTHVTESIKKQKSQMQLLAQEQGKLTEAYTGNERLEHASLRVRLPELGKENQAIEAGIEALEQLRINEELMQAFELFEAVTSSYQVINRQREEKFSGSNIQSHCDQIRIDFQSAQDKSLRLATEVAAIKKQLKEAEEQLDLLAQKLSPEVTAHGFSSVEELGVHLLSEAEVNRIRAAREDLQQRKAANKANEERLSTRLASQTKLDTEPAIDLNELLALKAAASTERNELNIALGAKRERLVQDDKDQAKIANKAAQLEKLEAELQKWSLLNKMIGDAMGHKFSNFAQGLTLQNLLVYANRRLKKLSDRYLLIKPTDDGALKVLDLYQGNSERSVATLSGGETFLLSLALALSLSDMASKNVSLDSLFIDEGFGTLDQETLDVAMTTLERLQSESQKTVGVISHVEALKERITVQVKLEKNSLGYSQIKVE